MSSNKKKTLGQVFNETHNWVVIVAATLVTLCLNLVSIEDGKLQVNTFEGYTPLMWFFWTMLTLLPPILAVVISVSFRKEGIKQGELVIKDNIEEYRSYLTLDNVDKPPRSKDDYLREGARRQTMSRLSLTLIVSLLSGQLWFSFSGESIIKTIMQLSIVIYFGVRSYGDAYSYATTELKEWYILQVGKFKKIEEEKSLFDGRHLDLDGKVYESMEYKINLKEVVVNEGERY